MNTQDAPYAVIDPTMDIPQVRPNCLTPSIRTTRTPNRASSDFSHPNKTIVKNLIYKNIPRPNKIDTIETILGWWSGVILDVNKDDRKVYIEMKDVNNIMIYDLVDIEKFTDNGAEESSIQKGATFTFSSVKKIERGENSYYTNLVVAKQYIWTEKDSKRAEKMEKFIFEE